MSSRIEEYAIIGDLHTVALVSRACSIDWMCLPHFDSSACFAALLGDHEHGRWLLAPTEPIEAVSRSYRPDTLVLETELATASGTVRVTDFMAQRDDNPILIRIIEGLEGAVPMRSELRLRFDYGETKPFIRHAADGLHAIAGPEGVLLVSPVDVSVADYSVNADFTVKPGDRFAFQMIWHRSWEPAGAPADPDAALVECASRWRVWAQHANPEGARQEAIVRSLITLKALQYIPTGGICAAATTSLPEQLGGARNWDYRYCWLRDSSLTLDTLIREGFMKEAESWRDWLVRAIAGDPADMQIMYGISGERRLSETTLDFLPGYENSAPVRIGNAASEQFQLDVYGEVMEAFYCAREAGLPPNEEAWTLQQALAGFVESHWQEPDDGIWEVRGGRQHFVYSKVMAWVAADRAAATIEDHGQAGDPARWRALADEIHADVCAKGVDPKRNCFVQYYGSAALDASLLMLPLVGFLPPDDPRIVNTVRAIEADLTEHGLVMRYLPEETDDGLSGGEGAFVMCSFWLVQALAMIGDLDGAKALFGRLLDLRNDVGLLSEEYDAVADRMLGNMPQAFSHVGLIGAAHALEDAEAAAAKRAPSRRPSSRRAANLHAALASGAQ